MPSQLESLASKPVCEMVAIQPEIKTRSHVPLATHTAFGPQHEQHLEQVHPCLSGYLPLCSVSSLGCLGINFYSSHQIHASHLVCAESLMSVTHVPNIPPPALKLQLREGNDHPKPHSK